MTEPRVEQSGDPDIAVVIVNYRTPKLTMRSVAALKLERAAIPSLRAMVVDGGSNDESAKELASGLAHKDYCDWTSFVPLSINGGFGWANNQAILMLTGGEKSPEFIYLLNPDTEIGVGAVRALVEELRRYPRCAAVGSQLLSVTGDRSASAFRFPSVGRELISAARSGKLGKLLGVAPTVVDVRESAEVDWVTGASVMFRTDALRDSGLFDDGFFLYFEEVELMHRLRVRGWTIRYTPESVVFHVGGASTGLCESVQLLPRYWYESRRRYFALTAGQGGVVSANLAALVGLLVGTLKRFVGRRRARSALRTADLLRFGFRSSLSDARPSNPALGEAAGRLPAWMIRR